MAIIFPENTFDHCDATLSLGYEFFVEDVLGTVLLEKAFKNLKLSFSGIFTEFPGIFYGRCLKRREPEITLSTHEIWEKYGHQIINEFVCENSILVSHQCVFKFISERIDEVLDESELKSSIESFNLTTFEYHRICYALLEKGINKDENFDEFVRAHKLATKMKFFQAVKYTTELFENWMCCAMDIAYAKATTEKAIRNAEDGIMILDPYVKWKKHLLDSDIPNAENIQFVISKSLISSTETFMIETVPTTFGETSVRTTFPKDWIGLIDEDLHQKTHIVSAKMCFADKSGYPSASAITETLEDAIAFAKLAIKLK